MGAATMEHIKQITLGVKMNRLTGKEEGTYKITTSHGTYYIFDMDNRKAMRVPAEGRNEMRSDNDWFVVKNFDHIEVGYSTYWQCRGIASDDWYTWRQTTEVVSIEPFAPKNAEVKSKSQIKRIAIEKGLG